MKCHWTTHEGQRLFVPYCMPGWHDAKDCICRAGRASRLDDPRDRQIGELEQENARLNRIIFQLTKHRGNK